MHKMNLPYNRQTIDESDIRAVVKTLKSEFLTTGPEAALFEKEIAEYTGAKYAVVCSSGTAALHIMMMALELNSKDTVVTSPITFIADANAVRFVGAQVIFADIRSDDVNIDVNAVRKILKNRSDIKAIIPVHFAGQPVDMIALSKIATEFGVTILEDACHAFGASYLNEQGEKVMIGSCQHSSMCMFSFHPIKSITTGEGGAITTNDEDLYLKLLNLRSHGVTKDERLIKNQDLGYSEVNGERVLNPWYYEMHNLTHNYRICDFQCALGRSQLSKLEKFIDRRNYLSGIYSKELLKKIPELVKPLYLRKSITSAYHLFVVRINFNQLNGGRAALMMFLQKYGIQTQVNYMPIYMHPYYQNYFKNSIEFPMAEKYYDECLSLPLFPSMKDSDPIDVVKILAEGIKKLQY